MVIWVILLFMLLLAIPAYGGQGWYLMMPPKAAVAAVSHTTAQAEFVRRMHETPLKDWDHLRSFDTARGCEQARDKWHDGTEKLFQQYGTDDLLVLAMSSTPSSAFRPGIPTTNSRKCNG